MFSVISGHSFGGLLLCRDAVSVFYSLSRLGNEYIKLLLLLLFVVVVVLLLQLGPLFCNSHHRYYFIYKIQPFSCLWIWYIPSIVNFHNFPRSFVYNASSWKCGMVLLTILAFSFVGIIFLHTTGSGTSKAWSFKGMAMKCKRSHKFEHLTKPIILKEIKNNTSPHPCGALNIRNKDSTKRSTDDVRHVEKVAEGIQ